MLAAAYQRHSVRGFTLIEVLIAMAILSVALAAANRASLFSISQSVDLKQRILAEMVAQNRLALHAANDDWLSGTFSGYAQQADTQFLWKEEMTKTPNPALMKVVVTVSLAADRDHQLRRIVGFLVNPQYQYANQ